MRPVARGDIMIRQPENMRFLYCALFALSTFRYSKDASRDRGGRATMMDDDHRGHHDKKNVLNLLLHHHHLASPIIE
jgi:hypothetical protein